MTISEVAAQVVERHQALLIKPYNTDKGQPIEYEVKMPGGLPDETDEVEGRKPPKKLRGFILLDAVTAKAMKTVYEALQEQRNKALWDTVSLTKLVNFTWKCIK